MMDRHYVFCALLIALLVVGCKGFDDQLILNEANREHDAGNFTRAIELYELLLKRDPDNKIHPDNGIIHYELGIACLDAQDRVEAKKQIEALHRLGRTDLAKLLEDTMVSSDLGQ